MIRRWIREYRLRQWERKQVAEAWARIRSKKCGRGRLGAVVAAGMVAVGILGTAQGRAPAFWDAYGFRLVSREQSCHIEWVAPQDQEGKAEERYGIRLNPAKLEFQFYHESILHKVA